MYEVRKNNLVPAHTASGDVTQPLQWSSEYADPELGLVYYNYRSYNPTDGRWIRRDPLGIKGEENLYSYVENGTIQSIDFCGLKKCHREVTLTHFGDLKSDKIGARDNVLKPGDVATGHYGREQFPTRRDKWVLPYGQKVRIYPQNGKPFDGQVADVGAYDKKHPNKATPESWIDVGDPEKSKKMITEKGCIEIDIKDACPCPNTYMEGGRQR